MYEPPNRYLRGYSVSADRYVFYLHDGSGNTYDQQYLITHELTHLYAWNTFGQPFSFLVSEGAAVYAGLEAIKQESSHIPVYDFCRVFMNENRLPWVGKRYDISSWRGHNNNLANYYTAGCFTKYLIETYGTENFASIYSTHKFQNIYGKDLDSLEMEFRSYIQSLGPPTHIDTNRYVTCVDRFIIANQNFFTFFTTSDSHLTAYLWLDKARISLLENHLDDYDRNMVEFSNHYP
jgi:hypothetical protein